MRQISHRPAAIIDACGAYLDKSQCGMESVRRRVRRADVDFTDNALVPGPDRILEQIPIKPARAAAPARRRCDHDPIHIYKAWIAGAEPQDISAGATNCNSRSLMQPARRPEGRYCSPKKYAGLSPVKPGTDARVSRIPFCGVSDSRERLRQRRRQAFV